MLSPHYIVVLNDNNVLFSVGRHVGDARPDDNEMIILDIGLVLLLP